MTSLEPILRKVGRRTIEILLWCGAGLGTLSILGALAAVSFGIVPLVFTSGSMSPEITTGSLGLARTVAATELQVGEVVSVTAGNGTRVTHRIVATEKQAGIVVLTLKGDTNPSPDQESYRVKKADRVFFTAPYLGRVIMFFTSSWGMFLSGLAAAVLLFWAFRRRPPSGTDSEAGTEQPRVMRPAKPGRRRADHSKAGTRATLLAVGIPALLLVTANSGTAAYFTDDATVTTTGFAALRVLQPAPVSCTASSNQITVSTTRLVVGTPARTDYTYWATAYNQAGVPLSPAQTIQMTGTAGSPVEATFTFSSSIPGGVIRVYSRIGTSVTGWTSEEFRRQPFTTNGSNLTCGETSPPTIEFKSPIQGSSPTRAAIDLACEKSTSGYGGQYPLACGTVNGSGTAVSVQYVLRRHSGQGSSCWNGSWNTDCTFRSVSRVANTDRWSVPGDYNSAYAVPSTYTYTLTIKAIYAGFVSEKSITFTVR